MTKASIRLQMAEARLAVLGEPKDDESPETTATRNHYRQMRLDALAEIGDAQHAREPYKDAD